MVILFRSSVFLVISRCDWKSIQKKKKDLEIRNVLPYFEKFHIQEPFCLSYFFFLETQRRETLSIFLGFFT